MNIIKMDMRTIGELEEDHLIATASCMLLQSGLKP